TPPILTHHFFLYHDVHYPDLHSFPTRRSSDLTASRIVTTANSSSPSGATPILKIRSPLPSRQESSASPAMAPLSKRATPTTLGRSEEHTSELQSRGHLVCRLLLEKKKKKKDEAKTSDTSCVDQPTSYLVCI